MEGRLKLAVSGSRAERHEFLREFANQLVFVPVVRITSGNDKQGTRKVQIVSDTVGDRKEISIFSAQDLFEPWAEERGYQCFTLPAGDLALTAPKGAAIRIDPGTEHEVLLEPREVEFLAFPEQAPVPVTEEKTPLNPYAADLSTEARKAYSKPTELNIPMQTTPPVAPASEAPAVEEKVQPDTLDDYPVEAEPFEDELQENEPEKPKQAGKPSSDPLPTYEPRTAVAAEEALGRAVEELSELLERFPSVEEAYLADTELQHPGCVLGVLTSRLGSEERFGLIEGVANISRAVFGEAGAIEVYDDLNSQSSRSWDLFNTLAPFYSKSASFQGDPGLADDLLRPVDELDSDEEPEDSSEQKMSLWQALRSKNVPYKNR
ncbi:MAG: SseB family protein [Bdellovibrionota bacterium]